MYYSRDSGEYVSSVETGTSYKPARRPEYVWHGDQILPKPDCALQLSAKFASDRRKANLRLAELAVCELYAARGSSPPPCNATDKEVCELEIKAPVPYDDKLQEPYIAAAMALVAWSKICALSQSSPYDSYKCEI